MRGRSGEDVEERLRQSSLYDPWLDLSVQAADGQVAGYALFWADPVTRVGLVEPMRVEAPFQRQGIARALLTAGIARLTTNGAERIKVGFENERAGNLYTGTGFGVTSRVTSYRLLGAGSPPAGPGRWRSAGPT